MSPPGLPRWPARLAWLLGAATMLPWGTTGCSADDVVVAELPSSGGAGGEGGAGGGGGAGGAGGGCTSPDDCGPFSFCERPAGSPEGECRPRPLDCEPFHDEVCGCDGVTYWNDCLRQQLGVPCARKGRCQQEAALCGGPDHAACPVPGALCARLFPPGSLCPPDAPGQCWVLPYKCPDASGPPTFAPCGPMMGPPMGPCVDACQAISSQLPHMLYPGPTCKKSGM